MTLRRWFPPLSLAAFVLTFAGCSSDNTAKEIAAMNTSNIQRLANLYAGHQNMKGGGGPKDEADLKDFMKAYDPAKLSAMGIDPNNLEKVFTSERDGKPFKIRWKVGGGRGSVAPVIFEEVGVNGKREVAFTGSGGSNGGGLVEEVDDARYKDLWAGKATAPASGGPGGGGAGRPAGGRPAGAPTGPPGG